MKTKIVIIDHRTILSASRSLKQAYSLSKKFKVVWIGYNNIAKKEVLEEDEIIFVKLKLPIFNTKLIKFLKLNFFGIYFLLKYKFEYLIIHDHKLPIIIIISMIFRKKLIYDAHELHFSKRETKCFRDKVLEKLDILFERFVVRHSYLNIQTNKYRAKYFVDKYNVKFPLVIENYENPIKIDIAYNNGIKNIRKVLGFDNRKIIIVTSGFIDIGNIWRNEKVVEALKFLDNNIYFCLIGFINKQTRFYFEKLAFQFNVSQRVIFLPPVKPNELSYFLSSADIAIVPLFSKSLNTQFPSPNKLYQAISAGLPIVASNNELLRSVIKKNDKLCIGELFDVEDPFSISIAIKKVLSNYNFYKNNVLHLSKTYFNWENEIKKIFEYIN
jgi:glycosyltransferase involved in cell wall biosynthesis